ncbi:D-amino-acid oxidase, partial [Xanthomonas oryzae pv. oryzae]
MQSEQPPRVLVSATPSADAASAAMAGASSGPAFGVGADSRSGLAT